jgi:AGZA family xanthine/uracil permease-like MFS transporter
MLRLLNKFFQIRERRSNVATEALAGLTTFLAMVYILAVNPTILAAAGMPREGVFTATVIATAVATLLMGLLANAPIALSCGMGLNAFFAYTIALGMGLSWQSALAVVFVEGIIFLLLTVFNVRNIIVNAVPTALRNAIPAGVGLFIALVGFTQAGIVTASPATVIGLGDLTGSGALLAILGLILTLILYVNKVRASVLIGMFATTVIGIPMGVTVVPDDFQAITLPPAPLVWAFDFSNLLSINVLLIIFILLFTNIFDTLGSVFGITTQAGLKNKDGSIPRLNRMFLADALGTTIGATVGAPPITCYVESCTGTAVGGRTGLTAVVIALLFLAALFFSPLFLLIPAVATAPALILVGFLMFETVFEYDYADATERITAFVTIVLMAFAYSITAGIQWGLITYVALKVGAGKWREVNIVTWVLFAAFVGYYAVG